VNIELLEKEFKRQVDDDKKREGTKMIYLPNLYPAKKVDYILIGSEPSLKRWAKTIPDAKRKIDQQNFKNFCWSVEDFILHYAIRHSLCGKNNYYITDLTKGAMKTKDASNKKEAKGRRNRWYESLCDDIRLFSKATTVFISIGDEVHSFLLGQEEKFGSKSNIKKIYHYSPNWAARCRGRCSGCKKANGQTFKQFAKQIDIDDIVEVAKEVIKECEIKGPLASTIIKRIGKHPLSPSRKKLLFDYSIMFEDISGKRKRRPKQRRIK
jgi:hypothetical protein